MKYILMRCRSKQSVASSVAASSVAALVASTQFLWSMVWEEGLSKFVLFYFSGMQIMTEISHPGLVLKLANDISAGMGLDFWDTVLGKL